MPLLPKVARWTGWFEKYVLSLLFLWIAWGKASGLLVTLARVRDGKAIAVGSPEFAAVLLSFLTMLFGIFFGFNLLLNRRALQEPKRWREITIPLLATFMLYAFAGLSPYMPVSTTQSLLPPATQRDAAMVAILLSLVGYSIALWSVVYLGRSLSLVVSVRALVSRGPYRFVRHPMYLGYIVLVAGIAIASSSMFSLVLFVSYVALTIYRARLEEETLLAFSEEYRDYAARTGFLLPGFSASR